MRAVILAGGLGTRLRPLTDHTPKPIVPLGNRPFAEYQIDVLRRAGIEDICFSLGYQSEKIESVLGDGTDLGVRLEVSDPTLYGLVETDGSGLVTGFREKPSNEEARKISHPLISAGIYLLEASVSRMIPSGVRFMFETDVFPSLIGKGARIASFSTTCYWRDIGTIENYRQGNLDSLRPPFSKHQENLIGCGCSIDESAELSTSVIGDRVALGGRSVVRGSVIHDDVSIGNDCVIEDTVIGRSCVVGDGSRLEPGTVLADETVI